MLSTFTGRLMIVLALLVIAFLQYKLWLGEGGYRDRQSLTHLTHLQDVDNLQAAERNRVLSAEVSDLKNGMEAVGLVRPGETFVQLSTLPPPVAAPPAS
jgi:cell division protein FtsB